MPVKYEIREKALPKEIKQFHDLLKLLQAYYANKSETVYFICAPGINGANMDALLITSKAVVGIEFKNYGRDGYTIEATDNDWYVWNNLHEPVFDEEGNHLTVKGGSHKKNEKGAQYNNKATVITQAETNRLYTNEQLVSFFHNNKDNDIRRRTQINLKSRIPWIVVFDKTLLIESKLGDRLSRWLKIANNHTFIDTLKKELDGYLIISAK